MSKPLSPQTQEVYDFIIRFSIDHRGNPPPVQVISRQFGIGFTAVFNRLSQLEEADLIAFSNKHGGIEVVGSRWIPPDSV